MKNGFEYDVVVIGGGASGMMSAICAGRKGKNVLILEKNKVLGNKLSITGGGRCNITNTNPDYQKFISNYGDASKYLHSAFDMFGVDDTIAFFESLGVNIVTEARHRAFPSTMSAKDVTNALKREIKKLGISVRTGEVAKKINRKGDAIVSVTTNNEVYTAKSFILATGGLSHPETGSSGDGFEFLSLLGHTVYPPKPSIVPIKVSNSFVRELSGVSVDNMKIYFYVDSKRAFHKQGKILFTHFGLSGPLILNSASLVGDLLHAGQVTAKINLFPDLDEKSVEQKIISSFDENKNKSVKNVFCDIAPKGLSDTLLKLSNIDKDKKVHSITKEERKRLRDLLVAMPLSIDGLMDYDRAVIADGGIDMSEINTKKMSSKKIKNLFITGDLLNINRPSGGFSLQLCWTTGYIAGISA